MRKIVITLAVLAVFTVFAALYFSKASPAAVYNTQSANFIIDPGHGGADGGAVAGDVIESEINLQIALKLDAMMGLFGVPAILTRDSEDIDYPDDADTIRKMKVADSKARVRLIQNTENAILVSIHQNKFTSSKAKGAQVFYSKYPGSKELADVVQEYLRVTLDPASEKVPKQIPDSIFLMKDTGCPAILAECGFISNPSERKLLCDPNYQTKIAAALLAALLDKKVESKEQS
ncbi:MAG: N-acetylmuramoyl-L-alanine amidase [Oscillospiraceae bacterium]|jgi:N-acetylmuramoyl-L-alanine amidase|nr:N-acetylmuramoyl-L-alanine amidase [Oscillospiraceae bacterium]